MLFKNWKWLFENINQTPPNSLLFAILFVYRQSCFSLCLAQCRICLALCNMFFECIMFFQVKIFLGVLLCSWKYSKKKIFYYFFTFFFFFFFSLQTNIISVTRWRDREQFMGESMAQSSCISNNEINGSIWRR